MEEVILYTGTKIEGLRKVVDIIFDMFFDRHCKECCGVNGYMVVESKEKNAYPTIYFYSTLPEHYKSNSMSKVAQLPTILDREAFVQFCWSWLKQFELREFDYDGTTVRGYTITGRDFYEKDGHTNVSLEYVNIYYGK